MIDDSDGDSFWVISLFTSGPFALGALLIAIILWIVAAQNSNECEKRACPPGMTSKLLDHECVCYYPSRPR
jgi:hypothetical protein